MALGIIPAAGKAVRWDGYYKELLPIGNGATLLDRCIISMIDRTDQIVIITTEEKIGLHAHYTKKYRGVTFSIQKDDNDIMGAIQAVLPFCHYDNLFAMPDTYYPINIFNTFLMTYDLELGVFETREPERFGVLYDGVIINKDPMLKGKKLKAWGVFSFSKKLATSWIEEDVTDYTRALNVVSIHPEKFTVGTVDMEYYYDIQNFHSYFKFLSGGFYL